MNAKKTKAAPVPGLGRGEPILERDIAGNALYAGYQRAQDKVGLVTPVVMTGERCAEEVPTAAYIAHRVVAAHSWSRQGPVGGPS